MQRVHACEPLLERGDRCSMHACRALLWHQASSTMRHAWWRTAPLGSPSRPPALSSSPTACPGTLHPFATIPVTAKIPVSISLELLDPRLGRSPDGQRSSGHARVHALFAT